MRKYLALSGVFSIALFLFLLVPSTANAAVTSGPAGRNQVRAYPGPGVGQVTLEWQRFFIDIENYIVHYGAGSGFYNLGNSYVGNIVTYTVSGLTPGQRYFFAVEGVRTGNTPVGVDKEVSAVAPSRPTTVVSTSGPVGRNQMQARRGKMSGTVDLSWKRFFSDTRLYNLVYGLQPGQYIYGVLDAVDTTPKDPGNFTYTIGALQPGKRYYFALIPQRADGTAIYVTSEVSAVAR